MAKQFFKYLILVIICLITTNLYAQISNTDDEQITSSLAGLTRISVTVGGDFIVNGSFPSSSLEKLDQFITRLHQNSLFTLLSPIKDPISVEAIRKKYEKYAERDIQIIRTDGTIQVVDLAKFRLNGDFTNNPYLKNGDVIVIPPLDLETNFISVDGAVNKPIKFQFSEGDNLQTALFFARGINEAYSITDSVEIYRLDFSGNQSEIIKESTDSNFPLNTGDRIVVLFDEMNKKDFKVLILGEVKRPGYISISKNNTRIIDAIKLAGGFTEKASLMNAELVRNYDSFNYLKREALENIFKNTPIPLEEEERLLNIKLIETLRMYRNANLQIRDTLFFNIDNKLRLLDGYSQLDFRKLEVDTSFESNFILKNGDVIIIPVKQDQVYVWGGVRQNGYFDFREGFTVWDYIEKAGGYTEIAYGSDEVYLIKGKTRDWLVAEDYDSLSVEPGDFVYVKKERPTEEFWFYLSRVGAVAAIVASVATVILVFK